MLNGSIPILYRTIAFDAVPQSDLLLFPAHWVFVGGGQTLDGDVVDDVQLVSLDPVNHPIPSCLMNLRPMQGMPIMQAHCALAKLAMRNLKYQ